MSKWGKLSFLVGSLSLVILMALRVILGGWIDYFWIPLGLSLAGFLAGFAIDIRFYLEFFTMRTTKSGMNMGALILSGLALVLVANYFSYRFDKTFDLTEEKLNSLSDQSMQVLKSLKNDLTFYILFRGNDDIQSRDAAKENLSLFLKNSKRIQVRYINLYEQVAEAKRFFNEGQPARFAVVVENGDRRVFVEDGLTEAQLTSALIKATRDSQKTIYFVTGHGEPTLDGMGEDSLRSLKQDLEAMSFKVDSLSLATGESLPSPTSDSVVAVISPRTAFLETELQKMREYGLNGGRLLLAIDPGQRHGLAQLTRTFGVEFKNNYILTPQLRDLGLAAIGAQYDRVSTVTKGFSINSFTLFFQASSIAKDPQAQSGWTFRETVKSDPNAVIVNDPAKGIAPGSAGSHIFVMEVEIPQKSEQSSEDEKQRFSRIVVSGDGDLFKDQMMAQMFNRDLALNIFNYLSEESDLSGIRPKQAKGASLVLTRNGQLTILTAGIGLPVILLILSGVLWYRRRNL